MDTLFDQLYEVIKVIAIAGVSYEHAAQFNALCCQDILLFQPCPTGCMRVGYDGHAGTPVCSRDGTQHLFHTCCDAQGVCGALEKGRLDGGALYAHFDIVDKHVRHMINRAMMEVVGDIPKGIQPRCRDHLHAGLLCNLLHEADVPPASHDGGINDRFDPSLLCGFGLPDGALHGLLLIIEVRPLHNHRIRLHLEVFMDQGKAHVGCVHGTSDG